MMQPGPKNLITDVRGLLVGNAQDENIKRHLEGLNLITPLYALNVFGCFRLSAVIHRLRQEGMDIVTEFVTFGNKTFACYMLKQRHEEIQEEAS